MKSTIPASGFIVTVYANVDNTNLTDFAFRAFIRNSIHAIDEVVAYKAAEEKRKNGEE